MAFVAARSDVFSLKSYPKSYVETTVTRFKNGDVTSSQSAFNVTEHICTRSNKTKNLPTPIAGTSSVFRSPSTYSRGVIDITPIEGNWLWSPHFNPSVSSVEVTGVPNPLAANTQYKVLPSWEGGPLPNWDTNQRNACRVRAMLRLGGQKAEFGTSLVEARSTYRMIADRSVDLLEALRAFKHGRKIPGFGYTGAVRRDSKRLANAYLELQFGWKPLMQDLYVGYELFREQLKPALMVRGSATICDNSRVNGSPNNPKFLSRGTASRWHHCSVWGHVDSAEMRKYTQVGLTNPASIGWEVVPYSFVIDWFMPIGNVLSAYSAKWGLAFVGGFESVRSEAEVEATLLPTGSYRELTPRRLQAKHAGLSRVKFSTWPTLGVYATAQPFNIGRAALAAALFRQALK